MLSVPGCEPARKTSLRRPTPLFRRSIWMRLNRCVDAALSATRAGPFIVLPASDLRKLDKLLKPKEVKCERCGAHSGFRRDRFVVGPTAAEAGDVKFEDWCGTRKVRDREDALASTRDAYYPD